MPDSVMQTEGAPIFSARSSEIKDLAMSLVKAQAAMAGAKKDSENPHFKNAYADLASVWDAVRKPLTDNDLAIVQFPRTNGNGVEIETTLMHGKTGQYMRDTLWIPATKPDAQGLGSAITYGRRYALMAVCGVAPVDDDGNAASAGAHGSAGGGTQFRPERRAGGTGPMKQFAPEAQRDGLVDANRAKGTLPAKETAKPADNAVKRIEWVKKAADALKSMNAPAARTWWSSEEDRIGVIETALPTEYERLLDAYNEALEKPVEMA